LFGVGRGVRTPPTHVLTPPPSPPHATHRAGTSAPSAPPATDDTIIAEARSAFPGLDAALTRQGLT